MKTTSMPFVCVVCLRGCSAHITGGDDDAGVWHTYKAPVCVCVFVCLPFPPMHVPPGLNWANSERGFCPFHAGITPRGTCADYTACM